MRHEGASSGATRTRARSPNACTCEAIIAAVDVHIVGDHVQERGVVVCPVNDREGVASDLPAGVRSACPRSTCRATPRLTHSVGRCVAEHVRAWAPAYRLLVHAEDALPGRQLPDLQAVEGSGSTAPLARALGSHRASC
jgi:hypothetical protein